MRLSRACSRAASAGFSDREPIPEPFGSSRSDQLRQQALRRRDALAGRPRVARIISARPAAEAFREIDPAVSGKHCPAVVARKQPRDGLPPSTIPHEVLAVADANDEKRRARMHRHAAKALSHRWPELILDLT